MFYFFTLSETESLDRLNKKKMVSGLNQITWHWKICNSRDNTSYLIEIIHLLTHQLQIIISSRTLKQSYKLLQQKNETHNSAFSSLNPRFLVTVCLSFKFFFLKKLYWLIIGYQKLLKRKLSVCNLNQVKLKLRH